MAVYDEKCGTCTSVYIKIDLMLQVKLLFFSYVDACLVFLAMTRPEYYNTFFNYFLVNGKNICTYIEST